MTPGRSARVSRDPFDALGHATRRAIVEQLRDGPRFAPRPIEASQPEPVRKDWAARRGSTWHKLTRPSRFVHYAELRKLLIEHGDHLARDIDRAARC